MTETLALPLSDLPDPTRPAVWRRHIGLIVGATLLGAILLTSMFAGVISPYDPLQQDLRNTIQPPSWAHRSPRGQA
jgi:peptide/nickel transport system permease protein